MTNSLMEYLPPIGSQSKPQPPAAPVAVDASGLPPLNLAAVSKSYFGRKAFDHDLGRENCEKWAHEYDGLEKALEGFSGTLLDYPFGTGRFFPIYRALGIKFIGFNYPDDMPHQARAKDKDAELYVGDAAVGLRGMKLEEFEPYRAQLAAQYGDDIPLEAIRQIFRQCPALNDKCVDVTVCAQFLKFLPEQELAPVFREIARVTRRGILCSLFTSDKPTHRDANRNWKHQLLAFRAMVESAGFRLGGSFPIDPSKGHHLWLLEAA